MDDKDFNSKIAQRWIDMCDSGPPVRDHDIYPMLNRWLHKSTVETVIDIGCGHGLCANALDLKEGRYIGVDASPKLIESAIERFSAENRTFIIGNAYELPVEDESVDAAFSVALWHLLSDLKKASTELNRVLKPGGRFLVMTANPESYEAWFSNSKDHSLNGKRAEIRVRHDDGYEEIDTIWLHTLNDMKTSLEECGLFVQEFKTFRKGSNQKDVLLMIEGSKRFPPKNR